MPFQVASSPEVLKDSVATTKQVKDALNLLSEEQNNLTIQFIDVDAEKFSDIAKSYKITSVPTVVFLKNGSEVSRVCGVNIAEITRSVETLKSTHVPTTNGNDKPANDGTNLESRLRTLINRAPIMLFMKGSPQEPRCGFSRQMVDLLRANGASFDSFDILTDETVRQGLKSYSNWPTYPQLYVKGELVGGLDIVKELASSGELADTLKV